MMSHPDPIYEAQEEHDEVVKQDKKYLHDNLFPNCNCMGGALDIHKQQMQRINDVLKRTSNEV